MGAGAYVIFIPAEYWDHGQPAICCDWKIETPGTQHDPTFSWGVSGLFSHVFTYFHKYVICLGKL